MKELSLLINLIFEITEHLEPEVTKSEETNPEVCQEWKIIDSIVYLIIKIEKSVNSYKYLSEELKLTNFKLSKVP